MFHSKNESQDYEALFQGYEKELTRTQQQGVRSTRNQGSSNMSDSWRRPPGSAHHPDRHIALHNFMQEEVGEMNIEAYGDFDSRPIDIDDEDLNAAFEAGPYGSHFTVIDEVGDGDDSRHAGSRGREDERRKFVIPRLKRPENEGLHESSYGSGDEGKREWRRSERDRRSRDHDVGKRERGDRDVGKRDRDQRDSGRREWDDRDRRDGREGRGERERHRGENNNRSNPIISFEKVDSHGLISENPIRSVQPTCEQSNGLQVQESMARTEQTKEAIKSNPEDSHVQEDEAILEIPMGRDSLVSCRDYYTWQVRMHPVYKVDVARADFAQMWGMADSSSVSWSDHKDFGGVIEFLLKEPNSIQKFMRKIMWHNFSSEMMTVEVTERNQSDIGQRDGNKKLDFICNRMIFKFNNSRARQLIKTNYPTPQGEVTERSVYVNRVNSGKAVNLLRALFPCSAKISVARTTKEKSTGLVETSSVGEAFNYLVVYHQISINEREVLLSTVNNDWEGAKKEFEEKSSKKPAFPKKETGIQSRPTTVIAQKRFSNTVDNSRPAIKKSRDTANRMGRGGSQRGRGAAPRGGAARGRGGALQRGRGSGKDRGTPAWPMLPDPPLGLGDGLLPLPPPPPPPEVLIGGNNRRLPLPEPGMHPPSLLSLPVKPTAKGLIEGELLGPPEEDLRVIELKEIKHELESRVMETRAQLESHLSQLDQTYRATEPSTPRRPVDYLEEEERLRDPARRQLLPAEGRPHEEETWREEQVYTLHSSRHLQQRMPVERGYEAGGAYGRERREDYGDVRSPSSSHPRPYHMNVPPEKGDEREEKDRRPMFDYYHSDRHGRIEPDLRRDEPQSLLGRPPALESVDRDRREYSDERAYRSRDHYSYEEVETRRPQAYEAYEEDSRRLVVPAARYRNEYDGRY